MQRPKTRACKAKKRVAASALKDFDFLAATRGTSHSNGEGRSFFSSSSLCNGVRAPISDETE